MLRRIKDGEDFATLAKRFSEGSTAQQGGYLASTARRLSSSSKTRSSR